MKAIKICQECYEDSQLVVSEGDVIIITSIEECEFGHKPKAIRRLNK